MGRFSQIYPARCAYTLIVLIFSLICSVKSNVIQLVDQNINDVLGSNQLVFVNFYADWCRFSQILGPVFEETAKKVQEEFPEQGKVVLAKVDCDAQNGISTKYHITKYPTLKLFRNGQVVKKEYRGQRSAESLAGYIKEQLKSSIQRHDNLEALDEIETKKRHVIGYFAQDNTPEYQTFERLASQFREDCQFHTAIGPVSEPERTGGDNIVFRPPNTRRQDLPYIGSLNNYDFMVQWAQDKCVPLVREITFENAEELTEEGLPFLILFHLPDDQEIVDKFNLEVARQLLGEKSSVNFLTADGSKFTHPLHHLGKTTADLPVLAIDSFRHMYIFPHNVKDNLGKPGLLKAFVDDLHSGKLHREFHHGPDPTTQPQYPTPPAPGDQEAKPDSQPETKPSHLPHDPNEAQRPKEKPTSPPESTFKKLAPNENRYTLLKNRDEL